MIDNSNSTSFKHFLYDTTLNHICSLKGNRIFDMFKTSNVLILTKQVFGVYSMSANSLVGR